MHGGHVAWFIHQLVADSIVIIIAHLKSKGVPATLAISPVGMRAAEMGVYLSALRVTKWSWMESRPMLPCPARLKCEWLVKFTGVGSVVRALK